jgi:hypothetical protein
LKRYSAGLFRAVVMDNNVARNGRYVNTAIPERGS